MKRHDIIFWLFSLCAVIVSCAKDDSMSVITNEKDYEFLLSVGRQNTMRMADEVVQTSAGSFRGIQKFCVIPFTTEDATAVTIDDFPLISLAVGSQANQVTRTDDKKFYYLRHCTLKEGTNRVLVYGQAAPVTGKQSKDKNGMLVTDVGDLYIVPTDIHFSLESICETDDPTDDVFKPARDLADYLTTIANTEGWSTDAVLKYLYFDFIQAETEGSGIMAGSAVNVKAYVSTLKSKLEDIKEGGTAAATAALCDAIIDNIGDIDDDAACVNNGYPASIGLPDGAAALRWIDSEKKFSVRTTTTTVDNITNVKRYTYPAELWYYANSAIKTSETEVGESKYQTDEWSQVLNYYDQSEISVETKSVAVEDPLQYGVACLQTVLNTIPSTSFKDAKSEDVTVSAETLPLTAVIIGGQHTMGFDFRPQGAQSDVDARSVYDKEVGTTGTVNTLVLQSYDNEKVPVILEFENKTGQQFTGKDGIIYPNTKFYLLAMLDPAGKGEGDCAGRVFTQDYTTTATMTVTSLANAFSCMPDLLSSRLEIGVQVETKWILSTPTMVKL